MLRTSRRTGAIRTVSRCSADRLDGARTMRAVGVTASQSAQAGWVSSSTSRLGYARLNDLDCAHSPWGRPCRTFVLVRCECFRGKRSSELNCHGAAGPAQGALRIWGRTAALRGSCGVGALLGQERLPLLIGPVWLSVQVGIHQVSHGMACCLLDHRAGSAAVEPPTWSR